MAIEGDIQAVLGALVQGRCFPLEAPENTAKPYIVFTVISNIPTVTMDGQLGIENRRIQIDLWDKTYGGVKQMELDVKAAMASALFTKIPLFSSDSKDAATQLHRVTMDYSIWS